MAENEDSRLHQTGFKNMKYNNTSRSGRTIADDGSHINDRRKMITPMTCRLSVQAAKNNVLQIIDLR